MSGVFNTFGLWWDARTGRERRMLMGLAAVVGLVLIWYGVIAPLWGWRAEAEGRLERARADQAAVATFSARARTDAGHPVLALTDVEQRARQAAETAGIAMTTQVDPAGGLAFTVERTASAPLFRWLATLEQEGAVRVTALNVVENADATLQAQGVLR